MLPSQEGICYERLAGDVRVLQHPLDHVAGRLVGGMLQHVGQEQLEAAALSLRSAMLEDMLHHKIAEGMPSQGFLAYTLLESFR